MKTSAIVSLVISIVWLSAASAMAQGEWISLFDGKTLDGWKQLNGTAKYEVVDGTIVGTTAEGSPNSFLCSDKTFGDFEIEFEVRCDAGLNSGVQIRSKQKSAADAAADAAAAKTATVATAAADAPTSPAAAGKGKGKGKAAAGKAPAAKNSAEGRVFGPQVEIECGPGQAGFVYGEATGLAWLSEEPKSKDKAVSQHDHFKNSDWNQFRIVAKGPRIETWINGEKIADLTHEEIFKSHPAGFIGLQVHASKTPKPLTVAWRNIRIRELK